MLWYGGAGAGHGEGGLGDGEVDEERHVACDAVGLQPRHRDRRERWSTRPWSGTAAAVAREEVDGVDHVEVQRRRDGDRAVSGSRISDRPHHRSGRRRRRGFWASRRRDRSPAFCSMLLGEVARAWCRWRPLTPAAGLLALHRGARSRGEGSRAARAAAGWAAPGVGAGGERLRTARRAEGRGDGPA